MNVYTRFSDIPDAAWVDGDLIGKHPLETYARLTEWILYNTSDETLPVSSIPAGYRQSVSDALWNDDVATYDGVLTPQRPGDKPLRQHAVKLITKLHDGDLPLADVVRMCGTEDMAYRVLDWCSRRNFLRYMWDGGTVALDGVLAQLRDYTEPKPKAAPKEPAPDPAYASDVKSSPAAVTVSSPAPKPVPAAAPKPAPSAPRRDTYAGAEVIPAPPRLDFTEKELRGIRIALELIAENQTLPRPTPVTPRGDSPVLDCARELAVLLAAFGTGTRNALRERVRVKLRPFTSHALEFGVKQGAFVLVGSPVRGGEYSLVDPEPLDMSWAAVKGLAARKKPLRALAGARGT